MKKQFYTAPALDEWQVAIENGIAASTTETPGEGVGDDFVMDL